MTEITVREMAKAQRRHPVHMARMTKRPGFPKAIRWVGGTMLFDADAVAEYFATHKQPFRRKRRTKAKR